MVPPLLRVSGLLYEHHDEYFNLRIAPMRAQLERHVGLIRELVHSIQQAQVNSTQSVTVHVVCNNLAYAGYAFVLAMLKHYDIEVVPHRACTVLYHMPDDGESEGTVCEPGHTNYYILHPASVTYRNHWESERRKDWHHVRLASSGANASNATEPPYTLSVLNDGLKFVYHQFVSHFALELTFGPNGELTLHYNNLINLCIMVKNAGPLFEQVLRENIRFADRWTILDTGSTDETLDIVDRVLSGKYRGSLHQEPFINFRDSRNRCLELAGTACKYNIMLDDTYIVRGDLRSFLQTVRGDEFASSYSLYIRSDDTEYTTNRVTRSELGLRYIFKIHEVIQAEDNVNVIIPRHVAYIDDLRADYMEERTMNRKRYDLELLLQSIEEEPDQPRHLYYTAQTYSILKDYENAAKYFQLRAESELPGFDQERVDACFELARIKQFQLKQPWCEAEKWYLRTLELEPLRVDALYFLGIYHVYDGRCDEDSAFPYFEKAFALGYPVQTQYSLKPTLVYYFLPRFLAPMCYSRNKWQLGYDACMRLLTHYQEPCMAKVVEPEVVQLMVDYKAVYEHLLKLPVLASAQGPATVGRHVDLVFAVDGNWSTWTGADIETKGLGGSETWAVEMATQMKQWMPSGSSVLFFCNCPERSVYRGVEFLPMAVFESVMATHHVSTCIVSRFSHYTFVPLHTDCDQVLLYLHDVGPSGRVLPLHPKLTGVYCLSPWHRDIVSAAFPQHARITKSLGYGIDRSKYSPSVKQRHSFIFSSFPDRGLLPLLRMWPRMTSLFPDATLHIFCNLQHEHVRRVNGPMMSAIDELLADTGAMRGVTVHGWVSKQVLAAAFSTAEYWVYPCIFDETFCFTALEAVASGVIGIAPPKAALQHMPLVFVPGDAASPAWADSVSALLAELDSDVERKQLLVQNGLAFARERSWQRQALLLWNECKALTCARDCPLSEQVVTPFYGTPRDVVDMVYKMSEGKLSATLQTLSDVPALHFNWLSHCLQKCVDPVPVLHQVLSRESGVIETPSPMVELLRQVEPDALAHSARGFMTHRYIVWTEQAKTKEHETTVLHIVPKLPCLEQFDFSEYEALWYECANLYPMLWVNTFAWQGQAEVHYYVHDVSTLSAQQYRELLLRAVRESAHNTRSVFPHQFDPHILDGSPVSALPTRDTQQHLAKLAVRRRGSPEWLAVLQRMKNSGFEPKVIYDIGACVLEWAHCAHEVWPDATIVVFDAMASLKPLYEESGYLYHIGLLGETDGAEVEFFENQLIPFGNSRYREIGLQNSRTLFSDAHCHSRTLQRLDSVVNERQFPLPDFVKMDVQGSEYAVIAGGHVTLSNAARLVVELSDVAYNLGAPSREKVIDELEHVGFTLAHTAPVVDTSHLGMPDFEFVKRTCDSECNDNE